MPTGELEERIEELEAKLKSVNKESGDRRMEIKSLKDDLENARGEAARLKKEVFYVEKVLDKVNIPVKAREADLSGLGFDDDGVVTGEVDYTIPVPAPPIAKASGEVQTITLEDVKRMSPQEVNENWDAIRKINITT